MNRDPRIDPQGGDRLAHAGVVRKVISRGVAGSVRFKKTVGTRSIVMQQRLGCWQRWARHVKL